MQTKPNSARSMTPFKTEPQGANLRTNTFDLSHAHKLTFKIGWLTPFLSLEALPKDTFSLSSEIMCRFAPLVLPLMHRVDLRVNYFFVPNRIMWDGWTDWIAGNESSALWPYQVYNPGNFSEYDLLMQYFGAPVSYGTAEDTTVSAFWIEAYLMIWDEYYRNPHIQDTRRMVLTAGANTPNASAVVPSFVNWGMDYFTAAKPSPQFGNETIIPLVTEDATGPYRMRKVADGTLAQTGDLQINNLGPGNTIHVAGTTPVYVDIEETAGTIRELKTAEAIQSYMEDLNRSSNTRYRDFMKVMWGTDPAAGVIDNPVWIGGHKGNVVVSEVMQTAQTVISGSVTGVTGDYTGQAMALESSKTFRYSCKEHGIILGLIDIRPRSSYFEGMPKKFKRTSYLDYATEHFAGIGDQEITNGEVWWNWQVGENNAGTFGYIPRYSEYRFENDIVSGRMRDEFLDFHLGRTFNTLPVLNETFIECTPRTDDVFVIPTSTDHEVYAHIWNDVKVQRALPKYGTPIV